MPGLYVRLVVVVSTGLPVSGGVGVISLSKCCVSNGVMVPITRFGWALPDIEGSHVSVNHLAMNSLRVRGFTGYHSGIHREG